MATILNVYSQMKELSAIPTDIIVEEVDRIVQGQDLGSLLGMAESETLEVKGEPYDLGVASGRYELAKDVSAIANGSGGHLIIGIVTAREQTKKLDILSELTLLAPDDCSPGQYLGVIREYVYPEVRGLSVDFVKNREGEEGVLVIRVPPQHQDQRPFLICKVVDGEDHLKQIVVGYAQRIGDSVEPLSPADLHRRFKQGMDSTAQRLTRIEEKIDSIVDAQEGTPARVSDEDLLDERMKTMLTDE